MSKSWHTSRRRKVAYANAEMSLAVNSLTTTRASIGSHLPIKLRQKWSDSMESLWEIQEYLQRLECEEES